MELDNTIWIILGVVAAIIVPISIFAGNQIAKTRHSEKIERVRKLKIHFGDIKNQIISHVSEMARSIAIRNERLVTSYAPIGESYPFAEQELYKCFELHFSEEAKEWKELNNKAVEHNKKLVDFFQRYQHLDGNNLQNVANSHIKGLQEEFSNFTQRLARKVESMEKFGIGTEFNKIKNCPICQKF